MDNEQIMYNTIERYLVGDLSAEEVKRFEEQLAADKDLRAELKLHRELQASIADRQAEPRKQQIKRIGQEYLRSRKSSPSNTPILPLWKKPWAIAASILVIAVAALAIQFFLSQGIASPQQLYAAHFETPALLTINRSTDHTISPSLAQAYQAYEAQDFESAIGHFASQAEETPLSPIDQYYWGVSHLAQATPAPDQAIMLLQSVIREGNNAYVDAARWYTALAYLKNEETVTAKGVLVSLQEDGTGKYQQKAKALLAALQE